MKLSKLCVTILCSSFCINSQAAWFSNNFVERTQERSAQELDNRLPAQPLEHWLVKHLPDHYKLVWRKKLSDCDEPNSQLQCVEVEIKQGSQIKGLLAFLVTENGNKLSEGQGLYHGHVEYLNVEHQFRKLGDLRQLNVERPD